MDTARNAGRQGKMMQSVRAVFFASLLLGLNGMVFSQEANATVCYHPDALFGYDGERVAIVTVTVVSSEEKIYDPPEFNGDFLLSSRATTAFTIDEVIYGNKEFPLESDSVSVINAHAVKAGDRYVVGYSLAGENWHIGDECTVLEPMSFVEFAAFYEDLLTNPCDADKHYLIRNSDREKVCVSHDERNELIKSGYGFYLPGLSFYEWKHIGDNPPLDVNAYASNAFCSTGVRASTGNYCIPYSVGLSWNAKMGNTDISISNLPNLGETATVTVSNVSLPRSSSG